MGSLEAAEDVMEEVSIEDITECILKAARAVDFESAGRRSGLVKKTTEHLEAERKLRGTMGEELKVTQKEIGQAKEKVQSQNNHSIMAEKEKIRTRYV